MIESVSAGRRYDKATVTAEVSMSYSDALSWTQACEVIKCY